MDTRLEQATRLIELERAQIGHEIHDALLPLIFAASASVTGMIPENSSDSSSGDSSEHQRARLLQVAQWLDDAMQTGRRLLTQVYPPELVGTLWSRAAKDAIERLFGQPQPDFVPSHIDWKLDPQVDEVGTPTALAAYRIVVEAVRNAIRHGKATKVDIDAGIQKDDLCIIIRDNGSGFDPTQVSEDRFGIRAMTGRAQLVGGSLRIVSAAGDGTTVTFRVPLAKAEARIDSP